MPQARTTPPKSAGTQDLGEEISTAAQHAAHTAGALASAGAVGIERMLAEPFETVAYLDVLVNTTSKVRDYATLKDLENQTLGHTFLDVEMVQGKQVPHWIPDPSLSYLKKQGSTSIGFHPAATPRINPLASYGPGAVEEPEDGGNYTAWKTYPLTASQLVLFFQYVNLHRNSQYSVYFYNCTTFAEDAVKASGHAPPQVMGGNGPVAMPNDLYAAIDQEAKIRPDEVKSGMLGMTPLGKTYDPSTGTYVAETDLRKGS